MAEKKQQDWFGSPHQSWSFDAAFWSAANGNMRPEMAVLYAQQAGADRMNAWFDKMEKEQLLDTVLGAIKAIPFLGIVAYVVEGVVAFGTWLYENSEGFAEAWDGFTDFCSGAWDQVVTWSKEAWEEVQSWGQAIVDWFNGWFEKGREAIGEVVEGLDDPSAFGSAEEYEAWLEEQEERYEREAEQAAGLWGNEEEDPFFDADAEEYDENMDSASDFDASDEDMDQPGQEDMTDDDWTDLEDELYGDGYTGVEEGYEEGYGMTDTEGLW